MKFISTLLSLCRENLYQELKTERETSREVVIPSVEKIQNAKSRYDRLEISGYAVKK